MEGRPMTKAAVKAKTGETFTPFDIAAHLRDEVDIAAFLDAAADGGTAADIARALGHVARARSVSELARKTGLSREALYRALSEDGNPRLDTLMRVVEAMGVRLSFRPV